MGRDNQEFEGALGLTPVMYAVLYNDMDMLSTVRPAALVLLAIVSMSKILRNGEGRAHMITSIACVVRQVLSTDGGLSDDEYLAHLNYQTPG